MLRAAALASVLAALAVAATASTAGSRGTIVHRFRPFEHGRIAPGVRVTASRRGYCWTVSGLETRRYAWRCFRGNFIHDPCFSSSPQGTFVLCPAEPWSGDVLWLRLTRPLPRWTSYPAAKRLPVGVWTTTGKRCVHSSGATSAIRGRPVTYTCASGGVLAGLPDRSARTWTIRYAKGYDARRLTRVGISDAWW